MKTREQFQKAKTEKEELFKNQNYENEKHF